MVRMLSMVVVALAACSSPKPPRDAPVNPPVVAAPDAPAAPTPITIENRRKTPIWVRSQTSCQQLPVSITAPDGAPVQVDGQILGCETARTGDCPTFGSCPGPMVWRIEPGKTIESAWDGRMMKVLTLTSSEAKPGCPTTCADWIAAPDGTYVLVAEAWSTCTGAGCDCAAGTCDRPSTLAADPDLTADAPFVIRGGHPAGVLLVFP